MRSNYHPGSTDDSFKITAAARGFTPTLCGKAVTLSCPPAEGAITEYLHGATPRLPGAPSHGLLPRHHTRRVCPSSYSQLQRPAPRHCLRQGTPRGLRKLTAPRVSSCCLAQAPRSPPRLGWTHGGDGDKTCPSTQLYAVFPLRHPQEVNHRAVKYVNFLHCIDSKSRFPRHFLSLARKTVSVFSLLSPPVARPETNRNKRLSSELRIWVSESSHYCKFGFSSLTGLTYFLLFFHVNNWQVQARIKRKHFSL